MPGKPPNGKLMLGFAAQATHLPRDARCQEGRGGGPVFFSSVQFPFSFFLTQGKNGYVQEIFTRRLL